MLSKSCINQFIITNNFLGHILNFRIMCKNISELKNNTAERTQLIFNKNVSYALTEKYQSEEFTANSVIDKNYEYFDISLKTDKSLLSSAEKIPEIVPYIQPSFNFAAYINKSQTLQELVKLGVNLHKLEKKKDIPEFILQCNFDTDIKNHLMFLHNAGVSSNNLGRFITLNPLIFKENLKDLQNRINYLKSKKFSSDMIASIIEKNPHWLMFSVTRIDRRLGYFQKTFALNGSEVRILSVRQPRIITYNIEHIKLNTFVIKEEMGISHELKTLLLSRPKLWMINQQSLINRFRYVHQQMNIAVEIICKQAVILTHRKRRIKQRHEFLLKIGKAQYDPTKPKYVSLEKLVSGNDEEFCNNIAQCSVNMFNTYLKSL